MPYIAALQLAKYTQFASQIKSRITYTTKW